MGWNYLSIPKLQRFHRWSIGMDKSFHPTLYRSMWLLIHAALESRCLDCIAVRLNYSVCKVDDLMAVLPVHKHKLVRLLDYKLVEVARIMSQFYMYFYVPFHSYIHIYAPTMFVDSHGKLYNDVNPCLWKIQMRNFEKTMLPQSTAWILDG